MRAGHPLHLDESLNPAAYESVEILGRRAKITFTVMAGLCVGAVAAGVAGLEPWPAVLGALFLGSGIAELVDSNYARVTRRAARIGAAGALPALLGLFFVFSIGLSAFAIATALAVYFIVDGATRAALAAVDRYWAWRWDELYALIALAMGVLILALRGEISGAVLWYLVAAELLFRGITIAERDVGFRRELAEHREGGTAPRAGD